MFECYGADGNGKPSWIVATANIQFESFSGKHQRNSLFSKFLVMCMCPKPLEHPKQLLLASNRHDGYCLVLFLIVTNRFASYLEVGTLESALLLQ
jgi:hypothetical protein